MSNTQENPTYRGQEKTINTILNAKQAKVYTMEFVLGTWAKEAKNIIKSFNNKQQVQ